MVIPFDGEQIAGVLTLPSPAATAVALLLHGGPGGSKDGPSDLYVRLAESLAVAGIASLRFDFIGANESSGDYAQTSASHQVAQYGHALNWLRTQGFEQVAVVGESFGGTCALGGYSRDDVDALVLLWPAIWLLDSVFDQFIADGATEIDGVAVGPGFFDDMLNHPDREAEVRSVVAPTLLIHGDADGEVPFEQSRKAYELLQQPKRMVIVPGAEHCLREPDEQALVFQETTAWLATHMVGKQ